MTPTEYIQYNSIIGGVTFLLMIFLAMSWKHRKTYDIYDRRMRKLREAIRRENHGKA